MYVHDFFCLLRTPVLCLDPHLRTWLDSGTSCSFPSTTSLPSLMSYIRSRITSGSWWKVQRKRFLNVCAVMKIINGYLRQVISCIVEIAHVIDISCDFLLNSLYVLGVKVYQH